MGLPDEASKSEFGAIMASVPRSLKALRARRAKAIAKFGLFEAPRIRLTALCSSEVILCQDLKGGFIRRMSTAAGQLVAARESCWAISTSTCSGGHTRF